MASTQKAQTLDDIVNAVRAKGYTVRYSGYGKVGVNYEVFNDTGFAIRDEYGLRGILNGTDPFFRSRF